MPITSWLSELWYWYNFVQYINSLSSLSRKYTSVDCTTPPVFQPQTTMLHIYKSSVYNIMTYGSETLTLDEVTIKKLNGSNEHMVIIIISGATTHQESSIKCRSFDLIRWIYHRRLCISWLGHILWLGPEYKLNQVVFEIFETRQFGVLKLWPIWKSIRKWKIVEDTSEST